LLKDTFNLHRQLLQILKTALGSGVKLARFRVVKQRPDSLVVQARLRYPNLEVVIKLALPEARFERSFEDIRALHRLVAAQTAVPVPEVIAADDSCREFPWRYLILARMPGVEWAAARRQMGAELQSSAYAQIGQVLAQLHALQFPAFGEIEPEGLVRGSVSFLLALRKRIKNLIPNIRLREICLAVLHDRERLFEDLETVCLCHEDLHQYNILFENRNGRWQLSAVLDFDKAWAGHGEIDLARLALWTGMTAGAFWRSYMAVHPLDPLYEQRRPVYQLMWCLEYARNTDRHLADTRRICRELDIPVPHRLGFPVIDSQEFFV